MAVEASRLMLERVRRRLERREDFAVQTTLAGRAYLGHIKHWRQLGYKIKLLFLELPSVELAIERGRQRVAQGGHDLPEQVIRRRLSRGLENFRTVYRSAVDSRELFDASHWPPTLVAEGPRP